METKTNTSHRVKKRFDQHFTPFSFLTLTKFQITLPIFLLKSKISNQRERERENCINVNRTPALAYEKKWYNVDPLVS